MINAFGSCVDDHESWGSEGVKSDLDSFILLYCRSMVQLNPNSYPEADDWPEELKTQARALHSRWIGHQVCLLFGTAEGLVW